MDPEIEEILEKRLAALEKKVFGSDMKPDMKTNLPGNNVLEGLLHAQSLMTSALSGREKINALIQRLPELKNLIESDFETEDLDTEMKRECILAMEPEIRETVEKFNKLQELLPVLDNNSLKNLPEMTTKLGELSLKCIELGEEAETVDDDTKKMINRYNDIITNISTTLVTMDADLTELEKAKEPKKEVD